MSLAQISARPRRALAVAALALGALVAVSHVLTGCAAWQRLEPAVPAIATTTIACVLAHSTDPLAQIVSECAIPDALVPAITDLLAEHKAAAAKELAEQQLTGRKP